MLTLSFSKNGDLTEENAHKDIEKMVDYLLNKDSLEFSRKREKNV